MDPNDRKTIEKARKATKAPFVLRRKDIVCSQPLDELDFIILAAFAKRQNVPNTTMLHNIIGGYADCKLNYHAERIKDLQELVRLLRRILRKYIQKFGEIPLQSP